MNRSFKMEDVGEARLCSGLEITSYSKSSKIYLSPTAHVSKRLQHFEFSACSFEAVLV